MGSSGNAEYMGAVYRGAFDTSNNMPAAIALMVLLAINAVASKHYLIETKGDGDSGHGDKDYMDGPPPFSWIGIGRGELLEEGEAPVDGLDGENGDYDVGSELSNRGGGGGGGGGCGGGGGGGGGR